MSYIVRIYDGKYLTDLPLEGKDLFFVGSGKEDDYHLEREAFAAQAITFARQGDIWRLSGKQDVYFGGEKIRETEIKPGDIYVLGNRRKVSLWIYEKLPGRINSLRLAGADEITFGRSRKCNLIFSDKRVSGMHGKLYFDENGWHVCDLDSSNGTFVNGMRIRDIILQDGDKIQFSVYSVVFSEQRLLFPFRELGVRATLSASTGHDKTGEGKSEPEFRPYPHFKRSPRLKKAFPSGEIEIQSPPVVGVPPDINWISVLLPPIAMVGIMVVVMALTNGNMTSLYYMAPMCLLGVVVSITSYMGQKKKHKNRELLRLEKYAEHIEETIRQIEEKQQQQREALMMPHPSVRECFSIGIEQKRCLWERRPEDDDFLETRIGTGTVEFCMNIKIPQVGITLEEDALLNRPAEVREQYQTLEGAPITLSLVEAGTCGIIGNRADALQLATNMIAQIATHHCYDDVKLVTLFSPEEAEAFEWIKWLPHSFDNIREERYMANDDFSAEKLLRKMDEILSQRAGMMKEEGNRSRQKSLPHYLFVIGSNTYIEDQPIMTHLTANDPRMGAGCIFIFDELYMLPKECAVIIEAGDGRGTAYYKENINQKKTFVIEKADFEMFESFARKLLPVRASAFSEENLLPACITFLEGYGVRKPGEINLQANWQSGLAYRSMSVPIGIKANGEDFYFDIHEKKYGPHGLVAGMTGSGKSEMVQSWILSMALKFSPQDVSFVLIDFKGTGLLLPFLKMPHLAGTISDLDTNINRNLISLENELTRRKALLNEAGVNNINDYLKLYKEGKAGEPLSFLFLVIDEFAEFKALFPDFMTVINRVFAIGRTLGVFAILLTQKPAGVVDDKMHANTRFRWCLKVASSADSREMLRHSDAVRITMPGRAYVQVGEDEVYEMIQSYWSGAPYDPERKKTSSVEPRISLVGIDGARIVPVEQEKSLGNKSDFKEIDAVVEYLDTYVKSKKLSRARKIWEPKLPDYIPLNSIMPVHFDGKAWPTGDGELTAAIGMLDDPHTQRQEQLKLDLSQEGHTAIYAAPGTGKTTLLQTLIMALCMRYSPANVHIYIMDFGGWSLTMFKGFPHVGGIANDNDAERIEKLTRFLAKEMEIRKYDFARENVGNIKAYTQATGKKLPYLVLALDNFAPVLGLYPDLEDFFISLTLEGASYGIYLVVTTNNTMSLGYKLAQNIKMALALQLTDRSDYAAIVGKTNGLEPENCVGRGLVKGTPPLEFQCAVPISGKNDGDRISRIKSVGAMMNKAWTGSRPKPIPIMPELISFGSIVAEAPVIGLSVRDIEPVKLSFTSTHYVIVSGRRGSGKSSLLQVIARQLNYKTIVFDSPNHGLKELQDFSSRYTDDAAGMDEAIDDLIPVLRERQEAYRADRSRTFDSILVMIDDLKDCFDRISDETAMRLEAIIRLGKGLNVNLLVAGDHDEIKKLYHQGEPFTIGLVRGSLSVLLGGRYNDHNSFTADIPYSEADVVVNDFEGYFVESGKATRFKAMYCR